MEYKTKEMCLISIIPSKMYIISIILFNTPPCAPNNLQWFDLSTGAAYREYWGGCRFRDAQPMGQYYAGHLGYTVAGLTCSDHS